MKVIADQNIPFVKQCFSSSGNVVTVSGRDISAALVRDADVLLVRSITKVNEQLLTGSKVKFVATATIGFEHVDVDYLKANNIGFASAPGSNANSVAEYIVAAMLEIGRKHNIELAGKSIGIIGVGNVGGKVEAKCKALDMDVILNDPPLGRQTGDRKYRPIEELFISDFITLHTPLTYDERDKTHHLANEKFFGSLKDGVVFINSSRGPVVAPASLKKAVKSGGIQATVLDVWEDEPAIDTELLEMAALGTPHIAGYSYDGKVAGMLMIYKAACEHFNLKAKYNVGDFLPEPEAPQIKLQPKGYSDQEILRAAVEKIYKIKDDDTTLRDILGMPLGKRCATFDRLRKEYPIRREFQNTEVILATEDTRTSQRSAASQSSTESTEKLVKKLHGIGFSI